VDTRGYEVIVHSLLDGSHGTLAVAQEDAVGAHAPLQLVPPLAELLNEPAEHVEDGTVVDAYITVLNLMRLQGVRALHLA